MGVLGWGSGQGWGIARQRVWGGTLLVRGSGAVSTLAFLWLASETPQTQGPAPDCGRSWLRSPRSRVPGAWDAHPQQGHSQQLGQRLPQCVLSQSPARGWPWDPQASPVAIPLP